jgi:PAS domain S-box-containing protein
LTDGGTFRADRRAGRPLQFYFAMLAILIILVAAAAGAYVYVQSAADAQQAATSDATIAAGKAAAQLNADFKFIQQAVAPVAAAPSTARFLVNPSNCSFGFAPVGSFDSGHIELVRKDGTVACTSQSSRPTGAIYAAQTWLGVSAATVVAPIPDPATGAPVAVIVFPVAGGGVIAWFLDLTPAGPYLGRQFASGVDQLEFLVTTHDGRTVIARSIDSAKWVGVNISRTPFATTSGADKTDLNGTARWYAEADGPSGWKVYVGADKATALAAAARLQQRYLGTVAVGAVAVMLAILFAYRQVVRPITTLSAAVRASRDTTARPAVPVRGPAEVATLGEEINQLISSVKRELTERETAERTYVQLFEASPLPVTVTDPATDKFLDVNDAALKALGYSRAEFLAMASRSLFVPKDDDERRELDALHESIGTSYVKYGPLSFRKKDGSILRAIGTTYQVSRGGRPAWVAMIEDVTEREKLERQAHQTQRLESLGQLAGGVAHDFNNLLGVILNVTQQLKSELANAGDAERWAGSRRDLDRIEKAAQSASRLTRQLLAFARREVVQGTVLSISEQVEGLMDLLRRTLGSHVILTATLPDDVWPVVMDPGQVEQVVINLAVNARDSMPRGGTLSITSSNVTVDAAYAHDRPEIVPGRFVQLQVSDAGTGMDKDTLDHVFEPFFTTKPVGQGTGLGLATVYGIVKQLGGHIGIYSELGHGTTVSVLIPATDATIATKVPDTPVHHDRGSATVLVVEDYADLRDLIEEILKGAGYQVLAAQDGAAGLNVARAHVREIDVLLTDIVMPNMLGPDLAEKLKSDNPQLRVLFMSGHAQPALGTMALAPGTQLLQKPFMADELLDKLHEVLAAPADGGAVGVS